MPCPYCSSRSAPVRLASGDLQCVSCRGVATALGARKGQPPAGAPASAAFPGPAAAAPPGYGYPPAYGVPGAPGPEGYAYPYGFAPRPMAEGAVASLVFGILGIVVFPVLGIPAIVMGNNAKGRIRASGFVFDGHGLATVGVILGWVSVGLLGLMVLWFGFFFSVIV